METKKKKKKNSWSLNYNDFDIKRGQYTFYFLLKFNLFKRMRQKTSSKPLNKKIFVLYQKLAISKYLKLKLARSRYVNDFISHDLTLVCMRTWNSERPYFSCIISYYKIECLILATVSSSHDIDGLIYSSETWYTGMIIISYIYISYLKELET